MIIPLIIPSYKPEPCFVDLVKQFIDIGFSDIIIVRDGGDASFDVVFDTIKAFKEVTLLVHCTNLGKGRALKTALNFLLIERKNTIGCVTVDADGQHLPKDALAVAQKLEQYPSQVVLGARSFDKDVPFRSRIGNTLTRYVFLFLTGLHLKDTQTGLRGIPKTLFLPLMVVHGERYEYETNMLVLLKRESIRIIEVEIETVYIESNRSSHFNPFWDSMKIYFVLLRYGFSGIFSAILDFLLFTFFMITFNNLLTSVICARFLSLGVNYTLNKRYVFSSKVKNSLALPKFLMLCIASLGISYICTLLAQESGWNVYIAKLGVDTLLFFANFAIQRLFVFNEPLEDNN